MRTTTASLLLVLTACGAGGDVNETMSEGGDVVFSNEAQAVASPCGSPDTYDTIREIVFDEAAKMAPGDPVALNDLRRSVAVNMKFPVVSDVQSELQRTECTGRLVIGLPPMARNAFSGEAELEADLQYSIQPAADGSGDVVRVEGIEYLVQRIALAEVERSSRRLASRGGPQLQRTFNPSFDCGPGLNNTERMICQDEGLSQRDRQLSDAFKQKLAGYTGAARQELLADQRRALAERARCADIDCIYEWYDAELQSYTSF